MPLAISLVCIQRSFEKRCRATSAVWSLVTRPSMILLRGHGSRAAWHFRLLASSDLYCQPRFKWKPGEWVSDISVFFLFLFLVLGTTPVLLLTRRFTELRLELGDLISESVATPVSFPLGDCMLQNSCATWLQLLPV